MNREDAIDLNEKKQLESDLFHAKEALKHMRSTLDSASTKLTKGQFLIDAMHTAYQCNESKVVSEASNKLLEVIKQL
jgi:hypothetical protein